mmetsp:Transcript_4917/g.10153  ORF Transcript_4917/g.10153 Transcript_4917/m.10153 type:complete len:96 (-) Transcript_4917:6-293(-)
MKELSFVVFVWMVKSNLWGRWEADFWRFLFRKFWLVGEMNALVRHGIEKANDRSRYVMIGKITLFVCSVLFQSCCLRHDHGTIIFLVTLDLDDGV